MFTIEAIARIQEQLQSRAEAGEQVYFVMTLQDGEGALVKAVDFPDPPNGVVQFEIYQPEAKSKQVSIFVAPESISRVEVWNERPPGIDAMGPMGFETAPRQ